jgi:hypothetical protein
VSPHTSVFGLSGLFPIVLTPIKTYPLFGYLYKFRIVPEAKSIEDKKMSSTNVSSEVGSSDGTIDSDFEKDKEQKHTNDIEKQVICSDEESNSETAPAREESHGAEKDFPDLVPSKSKDFPDGSLEKLLM